jgi:hypothetical protein
VGIICTSVRALINQAYFMFAEGHSGALASGQLSFFQIEGGPSWINSTQYQINATAEDHHASVETVRGPMMQTLLEDRFKLKVHYETREVPAYAFDLALEYAPDDAMPGVPDRADAGPDNPTGGTSIFTALQEQLGLKLEPAKGSREFLIIDHVDRPSEN